MRKAWLDYIEFEVKTRKRYRDGSPSCVQQLPNMCGEQRRREIEYKKIGFIVVGYKPPEEWKMTIPPWKWAM